MVILVCVLLRAARQIRAPHVAGAPPESICVMLVVRIGRNEWLNLPITAGKVLEESECPTSNFLICSPNSTKALAS
jgi:hypothetical protein